jgi:hypothetical protein
MSEERVPYGCDAAFTTDGTFESYRHSTTLEFEFRDTDLMVSVHSSTLNCEGPVLSGRVVTKIPYTSDAFARMSELFKNFQKGKK